MKNILIALAIAFLPSTAFAAKKFKLCRDSSGNIFAAKTCSFKKGETEIDPAELQGPTGETGAQGPQGATGESGARGINAYEPLPGAVTITGRFVREASQTSVNHEIESFTVEMAARAASNIPSANVVLKLNSVVSTACPDLSDCLHATTLAASLDKSDDCEGTAAQPTAPEGVVCVYPFSFKNITSFRLQSGGSHTFFASWQLDGAADLGHTFFDATWAYTEPSADSSLASQEQFAPVESQK